MEGDAGAREAPGDERAGAATGGDAATGRDGGRGGADGTGRSGARDVVVPLSLYKIVTVFSTLIAVVAVVGGFLLLDAATRRATAPPSEIDPLLAVLGLLAIAAGGGVYAFAARFRAPGMGTPKTDDDQGADDG
jgi:hypothetical protein